MISALENLVGAGKPLAKEPPDAREFERLRSAALARLSDAGNAMNSLEGRFDLAYKCHDIRNVGEYEGDFDIDERLVEGLVTACRAVAEKVKALKPP